MKSRYIVKRVRQAVISWILGIFIGLMAVGYLGAITVLPYFRAMARGVVEILPRQLEAQAENTLYFVEVTGAETYDTGFEYTSSNYGIQTEHAYYGALAVGTNLLIFETGAAIDPSQMSYVGTLKPASAAIQREVIDALVREQPELAGLFLPLVLDTRDAYGIWWFLGGILWLILLGVCMWLLLGVTNSLFNPSEHHIFKALTRYGNLPEIISEIEDELFATEKPLKVEKIKLSKNWLLVDSFGSFDAIQIDSLLWFYKHVTQHYYNGIPSGKTIQIYLYDKTGKKITIQASMKKVDKMLSAIHEYVPWAVAGYSAELLQFWEHRRTDLIAAVEQRKSQLQNEPTATDQA